MKIQKLKYIVCIGGMLLFASCVTSKYESPEITDDRLYRGGGVVSDSTTIADINWRTYFSDAYLQNLISEGIQSNYDLQIATARIKQTEAYLAATKLGQLPTLNVGSDVTLSKLNDVQGQGIKKDATLYQLAASASWEIDIWGKINSAKKSAIANYLQSEAYKRVIQTSLVANISTGYYSLLALDEQLAITENTIQLLEENATTMQYLKDAGIVTGAAVEQSKAVLYATRITVPDLKRSIQELENALSNILSRNPGAIERGNINEQFIPTELKYGVPAQLLSRRPDVQMYEYAYRVAFENTNISKTAMYPSLTITGAVGYSIYDKLTNFFDYNNLFANIMGGLTQPIFNQRRLRTQLEISRAQQEEALLNFKSSVLNAGSEVSNALFAYETAKDKDVNRGLQIESLEKSVDFTQELLVYGNSDYTEVLNAKQNLLSAQLGQINDRLEQLRAIVELYRALGGGVN